MRNDKLFRGTSPIKQDNFNDQKQVQNFNNASIYTKGFTFTSQANTDNIESINLGGKARFLHGIVFFGDANFGQDRDILNLVINSEQVINNVPSWTYTPWGGQFAGNIIKERQFYPLQRKLSGADSTQLSLKTLNSHEWSVVFYLSDLEVR